MGCCESAPTAPEVVHDDPGPTEPCTFTLKSAGTFSSDYTAYKGESTEKEDKWYFLNKQGGSSWSGGGECTVDVENFKREDAEKPTKGQVMWTAKFDPTPRFDQRDVDGGASSGGADLGGVAPFLPPFVVSNFQARDEALERYFQRAGREFRDGGGWRARKWQLQTAATILPGPVRGRQYGDAGFRLDVFARGTTICDYDRDDDGDGYSQKVKEFVDQLCYSVSQTSTQQVVASWWVPGDMAYNVETGEAATIEQTNPLFKLALAGGWFSKTPHVYTAEGWDPLLALLVAYLCAVEYSPDEIKRDLKSNFPDRPPRH